MKTGCQRDSQPKISSSLLQHLSNPMDFVQVLDPNMQLLIAALTYISLSGS